MLAVLLHFVRKQSQLFAYVQYKGRLASFGHILNHPFRLDYIKWHCADELDQRIARTAKGLCHSILFPDDRLASLGHGFAV